ncbi:MAG: cell division FtsA domain-containing protein [Planctomycetaceae bacterium]|jgi:Tfp pilus assembly PilM family ATPase|nr:cell division FtsA domain-containing protein [Planctomycetaceae bacterium]
MIFRHLNEYNQPPIRDYTERQMFLRFHDRFATACGIALQGLEQTPFTVDLLPYEKPSFFSKWKSSFRKKQTPAAWGFDFGYSCVKAVRVTFDDEGVLAVDQCFNCHHPYDGPPLDDNADLAKLTDQQIADVLQKQEQKSPFAHDEGRTVQLRVDQHQFQLLALELFLTKYVYQGEKICVAYPSHNLLCANITLPQMTPQQTWQAVQYEAKHLMPDNPNLFQSGYLVLGWEEDEENVMKQYIHLFSTRIGTTETLLALLQKYGISPNLMTTSILANLNYAHLLSTLPPVLQPPFPEKETEQPIQQSPDNGESDIPELQSILICDMGTQGTDVTFYNLREIKHHYISIGGQEFTKSIVKTTGETFHMAEAIKRNPTKRTSDLSKIVNAVKPVALRLVNEILLRLQPVRQSGIPLDRVVVLGGGFQLNGFANHFKSLLNAKWEITK